MKYFSQIINIFPFNIKNKRFNQIKNELFDGHFSNADKLLQEIDKRPNKSEFDTAQIGIYKSTILLGQSATKQALEYANLALQSCSEINEPLQLSEAYLTKAFALFELNNFEESKTSLQECSNLLQAYPSGNKTKIDELTFKLYFLDGKISYKGRNIEEAIEDEQKALQFEKKTKDIYTLADVYGQIGLFHFLIGKTEEGISQLEKAIEIYQKIDNKPKLLKIYNNIGVIYQRIQNKDKSLEYLLLTLKLLEDLGDKYRAQLGVVSLNIGVLYNDQGEINKALTYLEEAEKILNEVGIKDQKAHVYNTIGTIYDIKGDLKRAFSYYEESLAIFEEIDDKVQIGQLNNNIGNILLINGELDRALEFFERSINSIKDGTDSNQKSIILTNLIEAHVLENNLEKSNYYLAQLEELKRTNPTKLVELNWRMAKAAILRKSKRIIKRAEAQVIYQQVSSEEVIYHQITVNAIYNLCEMLIQELRSSGNEEILVEVKNTIAKLTKVAEEQNSFKTLVESKLMQSKIALLELDVNGAKSLMNEAQKIAEEKGLDNLANDVSGEYNSLIDQVSKWNDLIDSNVSLIERLDMSELDGLVSNIIRKKTDSESLLNETPEMLLVLDDKGNRLFSKIFSSQTEGGIVLDDQAVGDLLTAVNSFLQETFSTSGSIERLKHKDHTLMLKTFDSYLICYVFKGPSISASTKLDTLLETMKADKGLLKTMIQPENNYVDERIVAALATIFSS